MRIDELEQFVVHGLGFFFLAALERFGGAVVQMIFHQIARDAPQRFLDRGDLHDDVGAVAIFVDHFLKAADLPFDAAQAFPIRFFQNRIYGNGLAPPGAAIASATGGRIAPDWILSTGSGRFGSHGYDTLHPYIPLPPINVKGLGDPPWPPPARCYNPLMTLVEITFELQSPLTEEQLRHLGEFANTYGLRRFRLDETKNQLSFEYDASRLRETQVAHVLGQARIAVTRKVH